MEISENRPVPKFGQRHVLALWLFTSYIVIFVLRVSINVAIVSMVNHTKIEQIAALSNDSCPFPSAEKSDNVTSTRSVNKQGEFDWDHKTQGVVLSSFYYGYICTQLIGGVITRIAGARLVLGIGIAGTAALTFLNPIAARTDPMLLVALRAIQGLFAGVTYPCGYYLYGNWAPKQERSVLVGLPPTGGNLGTVLVAPLTALLCEYGFDGGWPSSFYVFGAGALFWCVGWFYFVRDTPAKHPTISQEERKYIEENCQSAAKPVPLKELPWKSILLSAPVWAVVIAQACYAWNFYTILIGASTYLKNVLHIGATLNGLMTSLPYVCIWITQIASGFLSGFLVEKGVRTALVRKIFYCSGMIISAGTLVVISYAGCNATIVVILICFSVGMSGIAFPGFMVNVVDIAPQYASILMGIANTFATLSGIVSPLLTGLIINKESTIATWQLVFYISAAISLAGAVIFAIFGDGEVQKWALVPVNVKKEETTPAAEKDETNVNLLSNNFDQQTTKV